MRVISVRITLTRVNLIRVTLSGVTCHSNSHNCNGVSNPVNSINGKTFIGDKCGFITDLFIFPQEGDLRRPIPQGQEGAHDRSTKVEAPMFLEETAKIAAKEPSGVVRPGVLEALKKFEPELYQSQFSHEKGSPMPIQSQADQKSFNQSQTRVDPNVWEWSSKA